MSDSDTSNGRRGKVARLIEEYGFEGIGDRLERRWTADGDERMSLRDLADEFNRELLRAAMADAGMQPIAGEVENAYRLLAGDDASDADRTRIERRLDRQGVEVDRIETEFVTYQAIRTFLRKHRDASYEPGGGNDTESERDRIQRLRGRVRSVTDSKLTGLDRNDEIDLGSFRTLVEVNVLCEDCGAQYGVDDLLDRGGCDCGGGEG